jgi:ubiquitin carboxyl-terminal hydrolase 8
MESDIHADESSKKKAENTRDPSHKGIVGIQNMGNTCYSNTTIQLIRACPELNAYIITNNFNEYESSINNYKKILLAYQDILKALWSAYKPAYVRPNGFINEVRTAVKDTVYEMFGMRVPNDSHEYLVYLLDCFHEATKKEVDYVETNTSNIKDDTIKMKTLAENGWNKFISKNSSKIVELFFGMMRKTIYCTNCKNNSYQWEVFNSLKIPCEGDTFEEWIANEMKDDTIEEYRCDNCNGKHDAKIYSHIWKLPSSLFVTLRRFKINGHKNITACPYNGSNISFESLFAKESDDLSKKWEYELRGVSDHHGSHMGGHYTAQFKNPINGDWWWFDDESSVKLDTPKFSASNYIFYFRKK